MPHTASYITSQPPQHLTYPTENHRPHCTSITSSNSTSHPSRHFKSPYSSSQPLHHLDNSPLQHLTTFTAPRSQPPTAPISLHSTSITAPTGLHSPHSTSITAA